MLLQAWHGILPQCVSAIDGSVCTGRSNWRVQAKMKMTGDKTATVDSSATSHFWSLTCSHHCCHTKCSLSVNQALVGALPLEGKSRRARVNVRQCLRQCGYAVIPAHSREEGKLCQSCIIDKAKTGSSTRIERTLINRADRWSPVVPHTYENPFPFLVCQSLCHSLPLSELVNHCAFHIKFSSLADSSTHSEAFSRARASSHQPVCLSSPFIYYFFSTHTQRIHPLARPFAYSGRGDGDANVRKCILSNCATCFLPLGYLPCIYFFPIQTLAQKQTQRENLSLRAAGVPVNGWGRRKGWAGLVLSLPPSHYGILDRPLCPQGVVEEKCVCTAAHTVKSCHLLSSGKHLFHSERDLPAAVWRIPSQDATAGGRQTHSSTFVDLSVHQKGHWQFPERIQRHPYLIIARKVHSQNWQCCWSLLWKQTAQVQCSGESWANRKNTAVIWMDR